jgi:hypothetical protein
MKDLSMRDKSYRWLWLILAISVMMRVGVALYLGDVVDAPELLTDQRSYHTLGARLLEGHGYSFGRDWYPFTPANTPTAHWSFLYSLFVAAIYALSGVHPLAVRVVQGVLGGVLLPWMVYRLARRVVVPSRSLQGAGGGDQAIPLIAAAIAAIYGYLMLYAATLMTETFYIVTLLWSLEVGLKVGSHLRDGEKIPAARALQLGLSLGLAALLRQSILPWVPVLFLWLLWQSWRGRRVGTRPDPLPNPPPMRGREQHLDGTVGPSRGSPPPMKGKEQHLGGTVEPSRGSPPPMRGRVGERVGAWIAGLKALGLAGLVLVACILPWTYRNYQAYGQFLLLNSNAGYAMYSAQHPMHGVNFREFDAAPIPEGWWGRPEPELDRDLMRLGIGFVLDDPVRYFLLSLSRVRAFFEFWPTPDTTLLHNIGRAGSFGLFLPFILYGLYLVIRNPKPETRNSLIFLFVAFYTLLHVLTWAMVRYRLPVDAVLIILAAMALRDLYTRGRGWLSTRSRAAVSIHPYAAGSAQRVESALEE